MKQRDRIHRAITNLNKDDEFLSEKLELLSKLAKEPEIWHTISLKIVDWCRKYFDINYEAEDRMAWYVCSLKVDEDKIRPFKTIEEVKRIIGKVVKDRKNGNLSLVVGATIDYGILRITLSEGSVTPEYLFDNYTIDGDSAGYKL